NRNDDGSFPMDIDLDILELIMSYVETGHWKHHEFNAAYVANVCDKFGIEHKLKKIPTHEERKEKREQERINREKKAAEKIESMKTELIKKLQEMVDGLPK